MVDSRTLVINPCLVVALSWLWLVQLEGVAQTLGFVSQGLACAIPSDLGILAGIRSVACIPGPW